MGLLLLGLGGVTTRSFGAPTTFPALAGDDVTPSMGLFRIIVDPHFRPLMGPTAAPNFFSGYIGYHSADGRMTSPTLVDKMTTIGRSARNIRMYPFPGAGIPIGAGSWDTVLGYGAYPGMPFAFFAAPPNTAEVLTEIKSFILETTVESGQHCTNKDPRVPTVPISWQMVKSGTFAGVAPRSLGMVQGNAPNGVPGPDFAARSFFDIFVEVNLPPIPGTESSLAFPVTGAVLTNEFPLVVTNYSLAALPPTVIYIHGDMPAAVPLRFKYNNPPYWTAGELFGSLTLAGHGTFPEDCTSEAALAGAVLGPLGTSAPELPVEWLRPNTLCPSPGSSYDSVKDEDIIRFTIPGQGTVSARNFRHSNFPNPINPPLPNQSATYAAANTLVTAELSLDGENWSPVQATGPLTIKITNTTPAAGTGTQTFDTEMLQLDLSGNGPFGPFQLRESPSLTTRQSLGKLTIRRDPRGYRIGSFFDVFLDLATDGFNWIPADRAARVQASAPAPAPGSLFISKLSPGGNIRLQWLGGYQLEGAQKVTGMYNPVPAASVTFDGMISTYDITMTTTMDMMFFRLSQQ